MKSPRQEMAKLAEAGYAWAVVQSIHLICAHEFYRLVDDVRDSPVRASVGLPLLAEPADYRDVAAALISRLAPTPQTATLLIGHGTDHPAWTAYPALARILADRVDNVHVATIEGETAMEETVQTVIRSGIASVRLVPLMLVAGVHVQEDIAGEADSWKAAFEAAGLRVTVEPDGVGKNPAVVGIFIRHIRDALKMIP